MVILPPWRRGARATLLCVRPLTPFKGAPRRRAQIGFVAMNGPGMSCCYFRGACFSGLAGSLGWRGPGTWQAGTLARAGVHPGAVPGPSLVTRSPGSAMNVQKRIILPVDEKGAPCPCLVPPPLMNPVMRPRGSRRRRPGRRTGTHPAVPRAPLFCPFFRPTERVCLRPALLPACLGPALIRGGGGSICIRDRYSINLCRGRGHCGPPAARPSASMRGRERTNARGAAGPVCGARICLHS